MYVIIWDYQVKAECAPQFEEAYSGTGAWAKLFQKSKGYRGTELLSDEQHRYRYLTIDRWSSSQAYESFLVEWKNEYQTLDAQFEELTERETLLGKWETH